MRVNIYSEELTERVEIISKTVDGQEFTGVRFYLELPVTVPTGHGNGLIVHKGPFLHKPGDDDSAAVTFWGKKDARTLFAKAIKLLDKHRAERAAKRRAELPSSL
jgi:hypothetical protein